MVQGIEGTEDWVEVAHEMDSCFDWSAITVWWSPRARRYFWLSDSGCSCSDHLLETYDLSDFEDGDKAAALRSAKDWSLDFKNDIRNFDPKRKR